MTDYEAYKLYCALKRHFNSKTYDFFKYNGDIKTSYAAFEKRNDKYFFSKLAKRKDVVAYLVANLYDGDSWVGDLVNDQVAEDRYTKWIKYTQSMSYLFKSEIEDIDDLREEIKCKKGQHPDLLKRYLSRRLSAQSLIILNRLTNQMLFKYWDSKLDDPVWIKESNRLKKLSPFVVFDEDKYKGMVDILQCKNEQHATASC